MEKNTSLKVKTPNYVIEGLSFGDVLGKKLFVQALLKARIRTEVSEADAIRYAQIREITRVDFSTGMVAEIPIIDIIRELGLNRGAKNYRAIAETAMYGLVSQWTIIGNFEGLLSVVPLLAGATADLTTNTILIKFSAEEAIQKSLFEIKNNYCLLDVSTLYSFRNEYAYRLYELFFSRICFEDNICKKQKDAYYFEFGLSELKYKLGILNPHINKRVEKLLTQEHPDYEKAEEVSKERSMVGYSKVKRDALLHAKTEIEAKTDYIIDFEPIKNGRGGKIVGVKFSVKRKSAVAITATPEKNDKDKKKPSDDKLQSEFIIKAKLIIPELPETDYVSLADACDNDIKRLTVACKVCEGKNISNLTGFLLTAIKENYSESKRVQNKKSSFHNFDQREYDYEQLEKSLLNRK